MSHVTQIGVEIRDLNILKTACERLGFTFVEGQTTYAWYGRSVGDAPLPEGVTIEALGHCEHAIVVPGATYEVGVVADKKGGYRLLWDSWQKGGLEERLGPGAGLLKQAYALEAAREAAISKGYSVCEIPQQNGAITLQISVGG